ncbi:hypothetical protein SAMN02745215_04631 [Desulfitobacterium chlororespirans DSM 11544]|uniref:Uncharacterized protein n=1 Tax=Desulfitobacterium chlororespirans DSM 11544 TaxID=1121395 RepID=A0A1M7UU29_9FIRM|nr:hypothetical protein SAMN02745215_04631 [Desulfitobacterium chlororespirans DSM 11544]
MREEIFTITPFAPEESVLFYSDPEKDRERGCIGHLRGDFGSGGKEFWSTWWEHQCELITQEFKDEFDVFINYLRKQGLLKDRLSMADYCYRRPEAKIPGMRHSDDYGFCVNTDRYQFFVRCFPHSGDYNFYVYCYQRQPKKQEVKQAP